LIEASYYRADICRKADGLDGTGGTAKAALEAIDGIIDSITKTAGIFFTLHCFFEEKWLKKQLNIN